MKKKGMKKNGMKKNGMKKNGIINYAKSGLRIFSTSTSNSRNPHRDDISAL